MVLDCQQYFSMAGNETIIDAPVTPAPIFAYRALRGMFFGSPDTPANAINSQQNLSINAIDRRSPTKVLQMDAQVRLTPPQKRKRESNVILSPTKSCLRTPGAMTPRRAKLKEVNVTFKDIRMSISPELSRKGREIQNVEADKENQNPTQSRVDTITVIKPNSAQPIKPSRGIVQEVPVSKKDQQLPSEAVTVAEHAFNLEQYMAKTDMEMKKLIRYGRKMRDYARQQEEENTKLKKLVEDLQQENARLKKGSTTEMGLLKIIDPLPRAVISDPAIKQHRIRSSSGIDIMKGNTSPANVICENEDFNQLALDELLNLDEARDTKVKNQPSQIHISTTSKSSLKSITKTDTHPQQLPPLKQQNSTPEPESRSRAKSPDPEPILPIQITTTGSTRLASDRLIAARARIQKKAELRKTSLESAGVVEDNLHSMFENSTAGAMADRGNGVGRGSISISNSASRTKKTRTMAPMPMSSRDNSVLDWAAL